MASVLQSSTEGYGNKRVHFGCDIDWEEEDRRSYRGADSRRRRKKRKKLEIVQEEELKQAVLDIFLDQQYENDIVELCQDVTQPITRSLVHNLIGGGEENAIDGESADMKLRRVLEEFRNFDKTLESLNVRESEALILLKSHSPFVEKFREKIPSHVVTSSSENSRENSPSHERKAKRQRHEIVSKWVARELGDDDDGSEPENDHVPGEEQNWTTGTALGMKRSWNQNRLLSMQQAYFTIENATEAFVWNIAVIVDS